MSKCEVLAASVLVLWMPAIGVAQEPTPLRNLPALKSILQDCEQKFADPRFAAIHGKVPFLTPETTTTMRLDVKPNPTELAALRALLPLVIDCDLKAGSDVSGEQRSVTLSSLAQSPAVGALALLASGRITYAEHAALLQGWQRRMTAEYEAKVNEQSTLTLSCVIQNLPPSVAQYKGLETRCPNSSMGRRAMRTKPAAVNRLPQVNRWLHVTPGVTTTKSPATDARN
jgi:hypothetical protein